MLSRTGPKKSREGSRGRAFESGTSEATAAATRVEPASDERDDETGAPERDRADGQQREQDHRQPVLLGIDSASSLAHETVTTAATSATRSQRLANGPQLPGGQARGEVVSAPKDEHGTPARCSLRICAASTGCREPGAAVRDEAGAVDVDEARGVVPERPVGEALDEAGDRAEVTTVSSSARAAGPASSASRFATGA